MGCGGIIKNKNGTFSTPRYPEVYSPGTDCKWIISAPPGNVVQITWLNFEIKKSSLCSDNYVAIFENNTETSHSSLIGKFCGQVTPPAVLSTTNLVTIIFHGSEVNYNMSGFLGYYNILDESTGNIF